MKVRIQEIEKNITKPDSYLSVHECKAFMYFPINIKEGIINTKMIFFNENSNENISIFNFIIVFKSMVEFCIKNFLKHGVIVDDKFMGALQLINLEIEEYLHTNEDNIV